MLAIITKLLMHQNPKSKKIKKKSFETTFQSNHLIQKCLFRPAFTIFLLRNAQTCCDPITTSSYFFSKRHHLSLFSWVTYGNKEEEENVYNSLRGNDQFLVVFVVFNLGIYNPNVVVSFGKMGINWIDSMYFA